LSDSGFEADGCDRLRHKVEPAIRAEVEAEYAERIASAGLWRRWRVIREMENEIRRRTDESAPPTALY